MESEVKEIYRRSGFRGRLRPGRAPAVLVVDFSRGFTDPACPLGSDMSREVELTRRLLDRARERRVPVIFTSIAYEPSLADGGIWLQKVPTLGELKVGSPWVEIDPRLGRRPDEPVVFKRSASAFFGTHLASMLVSNHVDTLIVTGATTSGCIRATVVDALQHGYPTFVVRECVADRAPGPHEANLFDMEAKYSEVVSFAETMDYLGEPGSHSERKRSSESPVMERP